MLFPDVLRLQHNSCSHSGLQSLLLNILRYIRFVDVLKLVSMLFMCLCNEGFIGYWLAPFCAIVLTEHFIFRKNQWSSYNILEAWDHPRHSNLPRSYAAVFTFAATIGFIVLCMQKQWWTGPIARRGTGDVGMLLGFIVGVLLYLCARWAERKWVTARQTD